MRFASAAFLSLLLALSLLLCGAESLPWREIFIRDSVAYRIVFELRFPRLLFAAAVGSALGALGGAYQTLFRNPLADPYVLGVSSSVILGMALAENILRLSGAGAIGVGLLFSLFATAFLAVGAFRRFRQGTDRILLFGMGMNFVFSSALFILLSYHSQQLGGGSLRWIFGQMPWPSLAEAFGVSAVAAITLVGLWISARHLEALSLGDAVAKTLGLSPFKLRLLVLVGTSLSLSLLVALTGAVGFVGLVVPHAARLVFGNGPLRKILLRAALLGAAFLALADVCSRSLAPPFEFPIGVVTTVLGGPLFLFLLWRNGK